MTSLSHPTPGGSALQIDPDPLLTAIPGMFGFLPERSLVIIAFADRRNHVATMRHDLVLSGSGRPTPCWTRELDRFGSIVAGYGAAGVVAVVVDDRFDATDPAGELPRYRAVFRAVERCFTAAGGVSAGFVLPGFAVGAPWFTAWEPRCRAGRSLPPAPFTGTIPEHGRLSDPMASPAALHLAVYEGRRVLARRSDLQEALGPLAHCDDERCRAVEPVVPPGPPGERDAERSRRVLDLLRSGPVGELSCSTTNELAEALSSVHVRDVLLALALTDLRDDAEELWIRLARRLTGRAGAAAATLLGHLHYMAGHGAFAGVALERALQLDPDYHLAQLLDSALQHGMRPSGLADVLDYSFGLGRDLGVGLPARTRTPA
ncbi:MAG: DUF4192 domain-containing protein [Gordonia sp. (in: high G+C Gram-positive bacteria)]|uniref:DUF4192 domain-containing protein n=1 Tax=Gordonia sp. (in: high G+C Gram-positive bacteria) TaxID=84139 RepID=UPI0039E35DC0